jgi:hypothetical protein
MMISRMAHGSRLLMRPCMVLHVCFIAHFCNCMMSFRHGSRPPFIRGWWLVCALHVSELGLLSRSAAGALTYVSPCALA